MGKITIKTDEASKWIADVTTEVQLTQGVLDQVKICLEKDPDDDIWFEFDRIVKNLTLYWNGLTKVMLESCVAINNTIVNIQETTTGIIQDIKNTASQLYN